jgi:glutathione peroxidase
METIFDFKVLNNKGEEVNLSQYKGSLLMIVNTASKCGFTPQYDGLQTLYEKYKERGLVILGFPCDQFKHQEPGDDAEIAQFCKINFGVTFPLMKKVDVFGANASPVFTYLTSQVPTEEVHGLKDKAMMKLVEKLADGRKEGDVRWNFTKFLISRDGSVIKRYAPVTKPEEIEKDIEAML